MKKPKPKKSDDCPHCGRCKHCGRQDATPFYYPVQIQPIKAVPDWTWRPYIWSGTTTASPEVSTLINWSDPTTQAVYWRSGWQQ